MAESLTLSLEGRIFDWKPSVAQQALPSVTRMWYMLKSLGMNPLWEEDRNGSWLNCCLHYFARILTLALLIPVLSALSNL